jgi:hypothetical protein
MKMMRRRIESIGRMTLQAYAVPLGPKLQSVGLMAVTAGHAGVIHAALQERPVLVNLAVNLTVSVV